MTQSNYESIQESNEDSTSPKSMQVYNHILNKDLDINDDEIASFSKQMESRGDDNYTDLCGDFHNELDHIHDFSDYSVDGLNCSLKFGTMNKLRLLISWMSTRMKEITFELYAEYLIGLTHEQYNHFRQENMIKMSSVPSSPLPGPTTPIYWLHKGNSEYQIALNNFTKGRKGMHLHFTSSRMIFTIIHSKIFLGNHQATRTL